MPPPPPSSFPLSLGMTKAFRYLPTPSRFRALAPLRNAQCLLRTSALLCETPLQAFRISLTPVSHLNKKPSAGSGPARWEGRSPARAPSPQPSHPRAGGERDRGAGWFPACAAMTNGDLGNAKGLGLDECQLGSGRDARLAVSSPSFGDSHVANRPLTSPP